MRGRWHFFLLVGLAVLLAGSLTGCGQYTEDDLYEAVTEAEDIAYERGYEKGSHDGYKTGYDIGYSYGEERGYEEGEDKGYDKGWDAGYEAGKWDWEQENVGRFLEHYQEGYDDGYWQGYEKGIQSGDWEELRIGYSHALDEYYELTHGNPELLQIYYELANEYDSLLDDHYAGLWEGEEINSAPFVEILSVTSPVYRGNYATLEAMTKPYTLCGIDVHYKSGKSEAWGLYPHKSDDDGYISWRWLVGGNTTPGHWKIVVTAYDLDNWLTSDWPFAQDVTYFEVREKWETGQSGHHRPPEMGRMSV